MRVYFFSGRNDTLKSGMSTKIWKIERRLRVVQVWWGPAKYDIRSRRYQLLREPLTKQWRLPSEGQAAKEMEARIARKLEEGYERNPRRRRRANAAN